MDAGVQKTVTKFSFDISVRELVEFVLRRGDLRTGVAFTSPKRALQGTLGHQKLQSSRPENYQAEVALTLETVRPNFKLTLRGRIDGMKKTPEEIFLEEIKTVTGDWSQKPSELHWAQLQIYGGIWNRLHPSMPLHLRLTYFHLETETEHCFDKKQDSPTAKSFLNEVLDVYLQWLDQHVSRSIERDASIQTLAFPFSERRSGQDSMMNSVEQLHRKGEAMMVEAPTGIGKTMASLFPSIKALTGDEIRQLMIVLARTPGQTVFQEALRLLQQKGARIKTLALLARDKVCRNGNTPCDPANCAKRLGHFDRLQDARMAAIHDSPNLLDTSALRKLGKRFSLCPHALAVHLVPWVDIIMGDYNYAFDPGAKLSCFFGDEAPRRSKLALLVDESHNLVDRGREMHSQSILTESWTPTVKWLQKNHPKGATILRELWKAMMGAFKNTGVGTKELKPTTHQTELFPNQLPIEPTQRSPEQVKINKRVSAYEIVLDDFPESWGQLMERFLEMTEDWIKASPADKMHADLLELYFEIQGFLKSTRGDNIKHRLILKHQHKHITFHRFCIDPSNELSASWKRAWSTLFFSATLSPSSFYKQLVGLDDSSSTLNLASPFAPSQWKVILHKGIATTFHQRSFTYADVAQVIHSTSMSKSGNYLAFFPSYEYLRQVKKILMSESNSAMTDVVFLEQTSDMDESARTEFLNAFKQQDEKTRIGFAVMGGIFGEGIDLLGDALIGVVVVGVGLSQVCLERDLIRQHFEEQGTVGFDYAYRFPGINRVMQAAGRLIRSEHDRGVAVLIDQRFNQESYETLLPNDWPVESIHKTTELEPIIKRYWDSMNIKENESFKCKN